MSYDKNGNILNITRKGYTDASTTDLGIMDNLVYTYDWGNKLFKVKDSSGSTEGFKDGIDTTQEYTYDANGNMKTDDNKGITAITYNHLNLPVDVTLSGLTIHYDYDASGAKQRKVVSGITTDYANGFQYEKLGSGNSVLKFFSTAEGYVNHNNGIFDYIYPDGMMATDYLDEDGNKLGDDGDNNGVNVMINNKTLASQVKDVYKKDGTVNLLDDQFSFSGSDISLLPSDKALGEALNVLDRTIANGGLSEESSLVYRDGRVVQGSRGAAVNLGVDTEANAKLPGLFPGTTTSDVEVSIHSHPTEAKVVGSQVFGGNATVPSGLGADATTFAQYRTNIIVGPLGQASATQGMDSTGNNVTNIKKPENGVVIYNNGGTTPSFQFSRKTVNKIIGN